MKDDKSIKGIDNVLNIKCIKKGDEKKSSCTIISSTEKSPITEENVSETYIKSAKRTQNFTNEQGIHYDDVDFGITDNINCAVETFKDDRYKRILCGKKTSSEPVKFTQLTKD